MILSRLVGPAVPLATTAPAGLSRSTFRGPPLVCALTARVAVSPAASVNEYRSAATAPRLIWTLLFEPTRDVGPLLYTSNSRLLPCGPASFRPTVALFPWSAAPPFF